MALNLTSTDADYLPTVPANITMAQPTYLSNKLLTYLLNKKKELHYYGPACQR